MVPPRVVRVVHLLVHVDAAPLVDKEIGACNKRLTAPEKGTTRRAYLDRRDNSWSFDAPTNPEELNTARYFWLAVTLAYCVYFTGAAIAWHYTRNDVFRGMLCLTRPPSRPVTRLQRVTVAKTATWDEPIEP